MGEPCSEVCSGCGGGLMADCSIFHAFWRNSNSQTRQQNVICYFFLKLFISSIWVFTHAPNIRWNMGAATFKLCWKYCCRFMITAGKPKITIWFGYLSWNKWAKKLIVLWKQTFPDIFLVVLNQTKRFKRLNQKQSIRKIILKPFFDYKTVQYQIWSNAKSLQEHKLRPIKRFKSCLASATENLFDGLRKEKKCKKGRKRFSRFSFLLLKWRPTNTNTTGLQKD